MGYFDRTFLMLKCGLVLLFFRIFYELTKIFPIPVSLFGIPLGLGLDLLGVMLQLFICIRLVSISESILGVAEVIRLVFMCFIW